MLTLQSLCVRTERVCGMVFLLACLDNGFCGCYSCHDRHIDASERVAIIQQVTSSIACYQHSSRERSINHSRSGFWDHVSIILQRFSAANKPLDTRMFPKRVHQCV